MTTFEDVLAGNAAYAEHYVDEHLAGRAAKGLAVVTCMDSRIEPLAMLGLAHGDAKILRTAGARVTDDVLRSLVLANILLGVQRVMVVAHTDCGMTKTDDAGVRAAALAGTGRDLADLDFYTIADQAQTLRDDVARLRGSRYLPGDMTFLGAVYDVHTGRLEVTVP